MAYTLIDLCDAIISSLFVQVMPLLAHGLPHV